LLAPDYQALVEALQLERRQPRHAIMNRLTLTLAKQYLSTQRFTRLSLSGKTPGRFRLPSPY